MKQTVFFAALLIITIAFSMKASARIWRVNNRSNYNGTSLWGDNFGGTSSFPVFKELLQAHNAAINGDTIHVEGSSIDYAGANITKKLVIIGPGFFLNENQHVSADAKPAHVEGVSFLAGSEGSQIIGVHLFRSNTASNIIVDVSNITIKRCRLEQNIRLESGISDIRILQCFFSRVSQASILTTDVVGIVTDLVFNNNILLGTMLLPQGHAVLECKNNIFAGPSIVSSPSLTMEVSSFQNNIMTNPNATVHINGGTNLNVSYNTGASAAQFGTSNNNVVVADMANLLFVPSGTSDEKYQLRPGTDPGSDGTDRGAFGGMPVANRYTASGLAAVPVIYEISTTGVATPTGLPVIIKARTIK